MPRQSGWVAAICLCCAVAGAFAQAPLDLEHELILDVRLDGESLDRDILAYQNGDHLLVSLTEFAEVLELPIEVNADERKAEGWFVEQSRTFVLDVAAGEVQSDGQTFPLDTGEVVVAQDDLFVRAESLSRWMPLEAQPAIRDLAFDVEPREPLPLQQRLERQSQRGRQRPRLASRSESELPLKETPYRFLGPHATDVRLDYSNVRPDEDRSVSHSGRYSLLSRGELGWMTSTLSMTGSDRNDVEEGRLRLERNRIDGPLNLEQVQVGDVTTGGARGVVVRGGPRASRLDGRFSDEATDLRGDILPGWEVELYQNGVFVDSQVVGGDGQYEFEGIPLEFGENRFELVFYGPFGEERREEEVRFVGPDGQGLGSFSYELAAVQSRRSVFDTGFQGGRGDRNTGRYIGNFNMGLTRHLTAQFGVDSFEDDGQRTEYYDAGLSLTTAWAQADTSYSYRPDALDSASSRVRTRIRDTRLNLNYTRFFTDRLEEEEIPDNRRLWRASARVSSRPLQLPVSLNVNHSERQTSRTTRAGLGSTFLLGRQRLSKSFRYTRQDNRQQPAGTLDETLFGTLSMATTLRPWRFRLGSTYQIEPETELRTLRSSASLRVDNSMTLDFEVRRNLNNRTTFYRAGFNWLLDSIRVSPRVTYDSNKRWAGLISLSTSIVPQPGRTWPTFERLPHANSSNVHARAFIDHTGDGEWGPDFEPIEGARVDAVQAMRHAKTGADGQAYMTRLPRYRQTDVALDESTLQDFELRPISEGQSVIPRPGSWSQVDIPMIRTMELEGHVRNADGSGRARELVELVDAGGNVAARQRSAFDGFYLFTGVKPGEYQVRLGDDAVMERVTKEPETVVVDSGGGVVRELDLVIGRGPARTLLDSPQITAPDPEQTPESTGDWVVQLGAFSEQGNAESSWEAVLAQHSGMLEGMEAAFHRTGDFVRLLIVPARSEESTRDLCERLDGVGVECLVRRAPSQ